VGEGGYLDISGSTEALEVFPVPETPCKKYFIVIWLCSIHPKLSKLQFQGTHSLQVKAKATDYMY